MKRVILFLFPVLVLVGCRTAEPTEPGRTKSIVILYENDVHCAIDGYTKLAGLRDAIAAADTAWVAVVSSGDFLQGGVAGALSDGQYIIDIMRHVGYTAITIGNHEFDYGGTRMKSLLAQIPAPVVCANFFEVGASKPYYAPYTLCRYGQRTVAYVGVLTPQTMIGESYSFYDSNGNQIYDLRADEVPQSVQQAVDAARGEGADYVVLLSHMGEKHLSLGISSHELIAATNGIDVVLDAHSHSVIVRDEVLNSDQKTVPVTQTGTQFAHIGKLVILPDGHISLTLLPIDDIPYTNAVVSAATDSVYQLLNQVTLTELATCAFDLTANDANGQRLVRKSETNLGDIITDAFREVLQTEIGLCNGGGIRVNIPAGTITYGDVVNTLPFNNPMVKLQASGATILRMLESCTASLPEENGQFPQLSGVRCTVHRLSHTVTDVQVYDAAGDTWLPIDPMRTYSVATTDYCAQEGMAGTLKDCPYVTITDKFDSGTFASFLQTTLGGIVPDRYAQPQGRITINED